MHRNFRHPSLAATFGLMTIFCSSTIPADATATDPVEVTQCTPVYEAPQNSPFAVGLRIQSGVEVRFVNHARVAANQVTFRLSDGPDAPVTIERGTFAPGVTIRAVFDTEPQSATSCRIEAARFADGGLYNTPTAFTAGPQPSRPHGPLRRRCLRSRRIRAGR